MRDFVLDKIDSEDIGDFLQSVEKSFEIKFIDSDFESVTTLGELCDAIIAKIDLKDSDGCTRQQTFYKLRKSLVTSLNLESKKITTSTLLTDVFPRSSRRRNMIKLENDLGVKISVLEPPAWQIWILISMFLISIVYIFFDWKIGILSAILSLATIRLAWIFGKELNIKTVGELSKKISNEHYLQFRRNPNTVNRKELEGLLVEWFRDEFEFAFEK